MMENLESFPRQLRPGAILIDDDLHETWRRIGLAQERCFDLSLARLRRELFQQVRSLECQIPDLLRHDRPSPLLPTLVTIHTELQQLQREFDEVEFLP